MQYALKQFLKYFYGITIKSIPLQTQKFAVEKNRQIALIGKKLENKKSAKISLENANALKYMMLLAYL